MREAEQVLAIGRCDSDGQLVSAGEPLASLQLACGGTIPGTIAIPALHELVAKAQAFGLKLARVIRAHDGHEIITAWVEVGSAQNGDGCTIRVTSWQGSPLAPENPAAITEHRAAIDRTLAELTAQLNPLQALRSAHHVTRSTGSTAAGWSIGSHSNMRNFDTWRRLDSIERFRVLSFIIDGKAVIVATFLVGQSGFVQNAVDPHPRAKRECTSKVADTTCANGRLERSY